MGEILKEATVDPSTGLPIGPLVDLPHWEWPSAELLVGKSVRLERLDSEVHGEALWEVTGGLQHAALWQYMSEGPFSTRREFDDSLKAAAAKEDPRLYAIVDQQTGWAVGRCALMNIRPEHGVLEVGHLLFSSLLQQTQSATEALYLLARYAMEELGYRRYEWKCNALNAKSRRAAERFGFLFEGTFRQHMVVKGHSRDSAWYSILDVEWPAIREALVEWLAPGNFDKDGVQIKRLNEVMRAHRK